MNVVMIKKDLKKCLEMCQRVFWCQNNRLFLIFFSSVMVYVEMHVFLYFFHYLHMELRCLAVAIDKVQSLISVRVCSLKTDNKGSAALPKLIVYLGEKVAPHLSLFISINSELVTQFSLRLQLVHSSWLWQ